MTVRFCYAARKLFLGSMEPEVHIWRVTKIEHSIKTGKTPHAPIAQPEERLYGREEAVCSNSTWSLKIKNGLRHIDLVFNVGVAQLIRSVDFQSTCPEFEPLYPHKI